MLTTRSYRCLSICAIGSLTTIAVLPLAPAQTQNSYPMLMSARPVAVQIGQTTESEISARYTLFGTSRVFVSGAGVTGEVVPLEQKAGDKPVEHNAPKPNVPKIKVRFTTAADAVPGPRDFRVWTPQGVSTVGQIVVVRDPVVSETGDNNTPAKAQPIPIPSAVCGTIETVEDVDCFRFTAPAGCSLVFRVWGMRLEDRIHDLQEHIDPILTIRNAAGATVTASDNHFAADPLLQHRFEQAGDYVLEVRDVRYKGNADWTYAIEVGDRPFITQTLPVAVPAGAKATLSVVGHNLPADPVAEVLVPPGTPRGLHWFTPLVSGQPANAIALWVTDVPVYSKLLPSGSPSAAGMPAAGVPVANTASSGISQAATAPPTASSGQLIAIPGIVNGRIEKPGDVERFTFDAKAGECLSFQVIARRAESGLDSYLRILNPQGAAISEADDLTGDRIQSQDSWLENWAAPADGKYTIELRDLHLRGGPEFTYALQVTKSEPYFSLEVDTDKTVMAPGIRAPIYVRVVRKNGFSGEVQLAIDGLPAGVAAVCGRILDTGNDGCIVLEAAANAPPGAANVRITGTAKHPNPVKDAPPLELTSVARPLQEYYSPGGGRGNYPVEMHTVSVAEAMDIRAVSLSANAVVLNPGESKKIEVTIERAPSFKGNVTLDVIYQHLEQPYGNSLPKGVTLDVGNSKTLLTGEETKGFITLKAAGDAPDVEQQLVPVMAHVSINFVMKATYCAEPIYVTVAAGAKK